MSWKELELGCCSDDAHHKWSYQTSSHRHDCQINMIFKHFNLQWLILATWPPPHFVNKLGIHDDGHFTIRSYQAGYPETSTVNIFPVFFSHKNQLPVFSFKGKFHILGCYVERCHAGWRNNVSLCEAWPSLAWRMILQGHHLVLGLFDREVLKKLCPDGFFDKRFCGKYFKILPPRPILPHTQQNVRHQHMVHQESTMEIVYHRQKKAPRALSSEGSQ